MSAEIEIVGEAPLNRASISVLLSCFRTDGKQRVEDLISFILKNEKNGSLLKDLDKLINEF